MEEQVEGIEEVRGRSGGEHRRGTGLVASKDHFLLCLVALCADHTPRVSLPYSCSCLADSWQMWPGLSEDTWYHVQGPASLTCCHRARS